MDGGGVAIKGIQREERPEWADRAREMLSQDEWTAAELEMLALPDMPSTARRIHEWMKRENVLAREARENGGITYRYNLYSMPSSLRSSIAARLAAFAYPDLAAAASVQAAAPFVSGVMEAASLPPKMAQRAAARLMAVRAWEAWQQVSGRMTGHGTERFIDLWRSGALGQAPWLMEALPEFHAKSLRNWAKALREGGMKALAGDYKPRVALLDKEEVLRDLAIGLFAKFPHASMARIQELLEPEALLRGIPVPSERGVQRWMKAWREKNALTVAHALNPDAARGSRMPAFGDAAASAVGVNSIWEMDTTPFDITLDDGRRWTIIGIIDVYTRDVVLRLEETTSGHRARMTFRAALMQFGVPKVLRTDNGSDLRNTETEALLKALKIDLPPMQVGRPDRKPFIERVFRTLQHDLVPLLPGYTGHNVAEAQDLRARVSFMQQKFGRGDAVDLRLSPAKAREFLDVWSAGYRRREHSRLGKSPEQQRAEWGGVIRRIEDERALDMLLAPLAGGDGKRVVGKKGIKADGGEYIAPELGDMVGETVLCRHDPADAGRLYVYAEDGRFVCVAEDWRLTGADPEELAKAAKETWRQTVKSGAADLRAKGSRIDKATIAMEMANRRAAASSAVVPFPRPAERHETPAIEEHGKAARASEPKAAPERSLADAQRQRWVEQTANKMREQQAVNLMDATLKEGRILRARAIRDHIAGGLPFITPDDTVVALNRGALTTEDAAWFEAYRMTAEWRWACVIEGTDPGGDPTTGIRPNTL